MEEKINLEMPVTVYGNVEKYNEVISKARVRIFYKYENRNGTYITDEFADHLLSTIAYAPVKGIFDFGSQDYTDHGSSRNLGRIYGVVPENSNISWEKHLDEDGIEREYACADVLLFTGLYKEAGEIVGKSQSMEIYDKSIEGNWQIVNGKRLFVFTNGCFLGLQVLGDNTEPCFEGASFFSLIAPIKELVQQYDNFQKQGGHTMPIMNFKLSDSQKFEAIWSLLNINYCEEGGWMIEYQLCEVYDDYAIARNLNDGCYERVYYSKNDETNSLSITEKKKCYILDVTEEEKVALETLRALHGDTYEKINETYSAMVEENESLKNNQVEFEQKIEELNLSVSTLTTERDTASSSFAATNEKLSAVKAELVSMKEENAALSSFKASVLKMEKESIIASYSDKLSEEIIQNYTNKIDEYDANSLKKELAYELVQSNPAVFSNTPAPVYYVPKDDGSRGGLAEILSKYKK